MKTKIYLASALFTKAEQELNTKLANELRTKGYVVYVPQEFCEGMTESKQIAFTCKKGIEDCDIVVANLEGADVDSGTAWECGYANALGRPVIGIRTDFRQRGDDGGLNCMLSQDAVEVVGGDSIEKIVNKVDSIVVRLR
jgi:nucleoside 2-deoxyribosyltransferase